MEMRYAMSNEPTETWPQQHQIGYHASARWNLQRLVLSPGRFHRRAQIGWGNWSLARLVHGLASSGKYARHASVHERGCSGGNPGEHIRPRMVAVECVGHVGGMVCYFSGDFAFCEEDSLALKFGQSCIAPNGLIFPVYTAKICTFSHCPLKMVRRTF